jgi:hypothetical protein
MTGSEQKERHGGAWRKSLPLLVSLGVFIGGWKETRDVCAACILLSDKSFLLVLDLLCPFYKVRALSRAARPSRGRFGEGCIEREIRRPKTRKRLL